MDDDKSVDQPDVVAAALASDDDDQPQVVQPEPTATEDKPEQSEQVEETEGTDEETVGTEAEPEAEQTEGEEEDLQSDLDPKEEARRRYEERQRYKAEREARINEVAKEYIEGGEDEYDQRLRNMEVEKYKETIERTEEKLVNEFERVKANPELQIFNPENKEQFNQRAYDKAIRDYNAGYVDYDQNGNMVGVKGSLFEHLTETAELLSESVKSGAVQQVRASRQMKSQSDIKPAAQPKETAKDPILDILASDD